MLKFKRLIAVFTASTVALSAFPQMQLSAFAVASSEVPIVYTVDTTEESIETSDADIYYPYEDIGTTVSAEDMLVSLTDIGAVPLAANTDDHGAIIYTVKTGTDVVSVDTAGNVTILKPGTATIEVYAEENDKYLKSDVKTVTVEVGKDTVTIGVPAAFSMTYGDAAKASGCTFASSATPSITLAAGTLKNTSISYSSNNTTVATVDVYGNITPVNAGTAVITVTSAANTYYNASSKTFTVTVNKKTPTLSVSGYSTAYNIGAARFNLTKSYNGDGAITYTSSNTNVLAVNSTTGQVTVVGVGTAKVTVSASAGTNYSAKSVDTANITVNKMSASETAKLLTGFTKTVIYNQSAPTVSLGVSDCQIGIKNPGTGAVAPTGTTTFVVTPGGTNTCGATINGYTLAYTQAGTVDITATYSGDANYSSASVACKVVVNKDGQVFATPAAITKTYGDGPISLAGHATLTKGNGAVTYAVTAQAPNKAGGNVVTISGNTMNIVGAGTATITATAAATAQYNVATTTFTVTVNRAAPVLSANAITKTYLDPVFSLAGHATSTSSENPLVYSTTSDVISITGTDVTLNKSGTATVTVSQAQSANYLAGSTTFTITVNRADPTITVTNLTKVFKDPKVNMTALLADGNSGFSCNSDGNLTVSLVSENPANTLTISGSEISFTGAGIAEVKLSFAQTDRFNAGDETFIVTVNKARPSIKNPLDPSSNVLKIEKVYKDPDFIVSDYYQTDYDFTLDGAKATYSSDNTDVLAVDTNTGMATVGVYGTATVTVVLSETRNYESETFTIPVSVTKKLPTMSAAPITKTYLDPIFDLTGHAVVESPGNVSYAIKAGGPTGVISITGTDMEILGFGTVTVVASVTETKNYQANSIEFTVSVRKAIATASATDITKVYKDPEFSLVGHLTTNSNGAVIYTVISETGDSRAVTNPIDDVIDIALDGTVTIKNAGTATVRATSAETNQFEEQTTDFTVTVEPKVCDVTAADIRDKVYLQPDFSLTGHAVTESDGTVSYSSSDSTVISLAGDIATITGAGTSVITVNVAATQNYVAQTCTFEIFVDKAQSTITATPSYTKLTTDPDFSLNYSTSSTPIASTPTCPITFSSSNTSIATVSTTGEVIIFASGDVTFTITLVEDDDYYGCSTEVTMHVDRDTPILKNTGVNLQFTDKTFDLLNYIKSLFTWPAVGTTGKLAYTGSFTYSNYDNDVLTVENGILKIVHAGETDITITTEETVIWASTTQTIHVVIEKSNADDEDNYDSDRDPLKTHKIERTYEDEDFNLGFHTKSDGDINYRTSDDYIASITSDGTISMHRSSITENSDHIVIYVDIAETRDWNATTIEYELKINKCAVRFKNTEDINLICRTDPQELSVSWNSDASYKYAIANTDIATVNPATKVVRTEGDTFTPGKITAGKAGDTTLTITIEENTRYLADNITIPVHVERADPNLHSEISGADETGKIIKHYGDVDFKLQMLSDSDATITYTSSDDDVATISSKGLIHIVDIGTVQVTASVVQTDYHIAASKTYTLNIEKTIPIPTGANVDANTITKCVSDPDFPVGISFSNGESKAKYTIEDESLATVTSTGIVSLHKPGTTTITISAEETEHFAAYEKTITLIITPRKLGFTGIDANGMLLHMGDINIPMNISIDYTNAESFVDIPLHFTSLNPDIVSVTDKGYVTAVGEGSGYIRVTSDEVLPYGADSIVVPVKVVLADLQYTINNFVTVSIDRTVDISPIVISSNANDVVFTYTPADSSILAVDANGIVKPLKTGSTTVTVTSADTAYYGGIKETIKVVVTQNTPSIICDSSIITVHMGESNVPLNVALDPASIFGADIALNYTSQNPDIVRVTDNGMITPLAVGEGFIKVTTTPSERFTSAELNIKVIVLPASLKYSFSNIVTMRIDDKDVSIAPIIISAAGADMEFTYSVVDDSVISVDANGLVTPKKIGETTVVVKSTDSSYFGDFTEEVKVIIKKRLPILACAQNPIILNMDSAATDAGIIASSSEDKISLAVEDTAVATLEGDKLRPASIGRTVLVATVTETETAEAASLRVSVIVTGNDYVVYGGDAKGLTIPLGTKDRPLDVHVYAAGVIPTVTYTVADSDIATVNPKGEVTAVAVGITFVTVKFSAVGSYNEKTVRVPITVTNATLKFSSKDAYTVAFGDPDFSIKPLVSDTTVDPKFTYAVADEKVVKVDSNGIATIVGVGSTIVNIHTDAFGVYSAADFTTLITVTKGDPDLVVDDMVLALTDSHKAITYRTRSTGTVTFSTKNTDIISLLGNEVSPIASGKAIVTASIAATDAYNAVSKSFTVTVNPDSAYDASMKDFINTTEPAFQSDLGLRITVEQYDVTKSLPFVVYHEQYGNKIVLYSGTISGLAGSRTSTDFTINTGNLVGDVTLYAQIAGDYEGFDSMPENNTLSLDITIPAPQFNVTATRIDSAVKPGQFISVPYVATASNIKNNATFPVQLEVDNAVISTGYITFSGSMNTISSELSGYLPAALTDGEHDLTVRIVPGKVFLDASKQTTGLADTQKIVVSKPDLRLTVNNIVMQNVDEFAYSASLETCEITYKATNALEKIKTITIDGKTYDIHENSTTMTSTLKKSESFLAEVVVESASGTDYTTYYVTVRRLSDTTDIKIEYELPDGSVIIPDTIDGVPVVPIPDDSPDGIIKVTTKDPDAEIIRIDDTPVNKPEAEYPVHIEPSTELDLPVEVCADDEDVSVVHHVLITRINYTPELTIVNSDEIAGNTYGSVGVEQNGVYTDYGVSITSVEIAKTASKTHGLILDVNVTDKNYNQYLKGYIEIDGSRHLIHWNSFDGPTVISARDVSHGYIYVDSSAFDRNVENQRYILTVEDYSDAAALNAVSSTTAEIAFAIKVLADDFAAYFDADQSAIIITCDSQDAAFTFRKSLDNGVTWTDPESTGKSIAVTDKGVILFEITLTDTMHNTRTKTVTATVSSDSVDVGNGINVYASTSRHADYIYINTNKKNSASVNSSILNIFSSASAGDTDTDNE